MAVWLDGDRVLRAFRAGDIRLGLGPLEPSGLDLVAAALARLTTFEGRPRQIALAFPRGRTLLPLFLSLYFTLSRESGSLPLKGCITLTTRDTSLRNGLDRIYVGRAGFAPVAAGRLVAGRPDPTGRASAKIGELHGTKRLQGLSPDDEFLLFQVPHYRPELSLNVVSVSIVDAMSMSRGSWEPTYEWNRSADRRQVWLGELADQDFADFCEANAIPLWRFDWGLIAEATARFGSGRGGISTTEVCQRSAKLGALKVRPCPDDVVDEELTNLEQAFASIYRRTKKDLDVPDIVLRARRLYYLLGRLVAPLAVYEPIAAATRSLEPPATLAAVREAPKSRFHGAHWKTVYENEWATIRGSLTALYEHIKADHPKYWSVLALIEAARSDGHQLVCRCSTRAEANALQAALVADGFVQPDELGAGRLVDVRSLGVSSPPLRAGSVDAPTKTVIFEPLPGFYASTYLSAEEGCREALLYPCQIPRFERLARNAVSSSSGEMTNGLALAAFLDPPGVTCPRPPEIEVEQLDGIGLGGRQTLSATKESKAVITAEEFWKQVLTVDEDDLSYRHASGRTAEECSPARLVTVAEGFCVFISEDDQVPVVIRDEMLLTPVERLRPGQRIVLMPGADRSTMLEDLFRLYDEKLGEAWPRLYEQALAAAWVNAGGSDAALAARVGVEESTVASWRRGEHRPQQDDHLNAVLKLSGNDPAWTNRTAIRKYLATVRGAHRSIARTFNDAVAETVVELGGQRQAQLQQLGLDLDNFLTAIQVLTVSSVSGDATKVPSSLIGQFLTPDHPALKGDA